MASIAEELASTPSRLESLPLTKVLRRRMLARPRATAFVVLRPTRAGFDERRVTLSELERSLRTTALSLRIHGVRRGDRVLLLVSNPEMFAAWFLGALALGAIPVPLPSYAEFSNVDSLRERVRAVCDDCEPGAIVIGARGIAAVDNLGLNSPFIAEDIATSKRDAAVIPGSMLGEADELGDVAYLQYTSGSTGRPRGVVVDHGNLLSNVRAIAKSARLGPDDTCVSWLPLFHDMGLVGGLLLSLYLGSRTCLMSPRDFVLRPSSWLDAVSRYRATFTVAPNFAYNVAARRASAAAVARLDLSALRLAFNGAEPIDRKTIDAFVEAYAPAGLRAEAMYPVYGLAETTLAAAFPTPGSGAVFDSVDRETIATSGRAIWRDPADSGALSVARVGRAMPGHRIRIVSPMSAEVPERVLGEITVEGPSVTRGHWGERARGGKQLRTGDLGYLADGELYVVDRIKDLVIVGGRNYCPRDIERAAEGVEGVTAGAVVAFGATSSDGTESLVLIATLHPTSWRRSRAIRREVSRAVHARIGVGPRVVRLVRPGTIPKTSSGKVRRRESKALFDEGAFDDARGVTSRIRMKAQRLSRQAQMYVMAAAEGGKR